MSDKPLHLEDIHGPLTVSAGHDKAVALAEKHGARVKGFEEGLAWDYFEFSEKQLTAMLADHRQQIIEELAQGSGVMPVVMCVAGDLQDDVPVITETRVREAIASLEAKLEQRDAEIQRQYACITSHNNITREAEAKLEQSEERVRELKSALLQIARKAEALKRPCGEDACSPQAIRNAEYMSLSYSARAAINKESGK
jgi:hypothetical protein